jgi:hypothetical protein
MSRIMTTSEIANFKMIGDVIELRECYQCGGETLGPVVKHSVRDSTKVDVIHNRLTSREEL